MATQDDVYGVDPSNWLAFTVFASLATQWRSKTLVGVKDAVTIYDGLRYSSFKTVCWAMRIKKQHRAGLLEDIRIMELAALKVMNE